jgi:uncharacterized membrane protein (DUF485 family)
MKPPLQRRYFSEIQAENMHWSFFMGKLSFPVVLAVLILMGHYAQLLLVPFMNEWMREFIIFTPAVIHTLTVTIFSFLTMLSYGVS